MTTPRLAIGIDIGGTRAKAALLRETGEVLRWEMIATEDLGTGDAPAAVADLCRQLCREEGIGLEAVSSIGFAVPGPVDPRTGRAAAYVNLRGWRRNPSEELEELLNRPAFLENDANAAAYGEYFILHAAEDAIRDLAMIVIGTGVGGGIVTDGRLLRGMAGVAGELGHIVVEPGGRPCPCGQLGCLERYASATAVGMRYQELAAIDPDAEPPDAKAIFDAADRGDAAAARVVAESIRYLAIGCHAVSRLVDPAVIVLGGGIANSGEPWLERVRGDLESLQWNLPTRRPQLRLSQLGDRAGAVGAGLIALGRLDAATPSRVPAAG